MLTELSKIGVVIVCSFFNYNRINLGLTNPTVDMHMRALFGDDRTERMRKVLKTLSPNEREAFILEELSQAIKELGGNYVLPFVFKRDANNRISHCLVFVSKNIRGYEIMKQIMAKESSTADQGVPSFTYSAADSRTPLLFSLSRPLDALENLLLEKFSGRSLTMKDIYSQHHVDTPFIEANYKAALNSLEEKGMILANPPAIDRPMRKGVRTFADKVSVSFPTRSK